MTTHNRSGTRTQSFTLGCRPTVGTLPFASRVCADIAGHRQAMLAPRAARSVCSGGPMQPDVQIVVVNGASRSSFGGAPGCGWPGGIPVAVYLAAATRDARELRLIEPRLRCEDDPAFFVEPTPWASIDACVHGLWTGSAEHAIRRAELTPQIKGLDPAKLFPADPGAMRCRIAAGGPLFAHRPRSFQGLCGVNLTGSASNKLVHFVETWTVGGHVFRHRWTIRGSTLVAQHGPAPPQRWS